MLAGDNYYVLFGQLWARYCDIGHLGIGERIGNGGDLFINSVGGAIDIESDDRIYIGGDAVISGSLTLDLNGGYQMTASAGNYTSVIDPSFIPLIKTL